MELPWGPGFTSSSAVVQGRLHVVTYKNNVTFKDVTDSDAHPQFVWVSGWGCVGLGWGAGSGWEELSCGLGGLG